MKYFIYLEKIEYLKISSTKLGNRELDNLALGNLKRTQGELVFGHHLQIIRLNGCQQVLLA